MYPNNQKCLREEITRNILVNGVYEVAPVEGQQIDYVVSIFIKQFIFNIIQLRNLIFDH